MSEASGNPRARQVLTAFLLVLAVFAMAMVVIGEYAIAGVTFLAVTFVIYLRETW